MRSLVDGVDKVFAGSIPDAYDDYLVPLIFVQYADDLARRTAALDPQRVMEVAADRGVVSRAVAADLTSSILERAVSMQDDLVRTEREQADAPSLPFDDGSFELVLCQFCAMFFPDRVRAYMEAHRVLGDGGVFIFKMWDRIDENDFAFEVTRGLCEAFPNDPQDFLRLTPHGHYGTATYHLELYAAGFSDVSVEPLDAASVASNPAVPAVAYCQGTPLRNEIEAKNEPSLEEATARATDAIHQCFGDGEVRSRIKGFVITAR